jgi:hypothetical protein
MTYSKIRGTEYSSPDYLSTNRQRVSTRYEYSDSLDRVTLISRANVEENRGSRDMAEVNNFGITSE